MSISGNVLIPLLIVISIPAGISGSRMSIMLGGSQVWKMIQHAAPNILPIIITDTAGSLGGVIMMEASMNSLGFGVSVTPLLVRLALRPGAQQHVCRTNGKRPLRKFPSCNGPFWSLFTSP